MRPFIRNTHLSSFFKWVSEAEIIFFRHFEALSLLVEFFDVLLPQFHRDLLIYEWSVFILWFNLLCELPISVCERIHFRVLIPLVSEFKPLRLLEVNFFDQELHTHTLTLLNTRFPETLNTLSDCLDLSLDTLHILLLKIDCTDYFISFPVSADFLAWLWNVWFLAFSLLASFPEATICIRSDIRPV